MLEAIGGRKFIAMIIGILAGCAIEIYGKNGLSTQMASLIAALVATFSGANALITNSVASTPAPAFDPMAVAGVIDGPINEIVSNVKASIGQVADAQLQSKAALDQVLQSNANLQKGIAVLINSSARS